MCVDDAAGNEGVLIRTTRPPSGTSKFSRGPTRFAV